ncbi:MAG: hypothetical protein A3H97_00695 [Acidobacteria bacterium RIFCSPLOWO2_02_FULL_65_29]|nr:MAG: hypothetical protein A3H97_00695 [Acidobacteria bacterium RIFCSPLOWO2_02_FULL_65_29]
MAVDVTTTPTFTVGPPRLLFRAPITIPREGNPNDDQFGRISRDGQRVAFQVLTLPERKLVTVAPEILAQYTGTYVNPGGDEGLVSLEGNQLMLKPPGAGEKLPLFAESETLESEALLSS